MPDVEDKELRDKFYSFGEISSIKVAMQRSSSMPAHLAAPHCAAAHSMTGLLQVDALACRLSNATVCQANRIAAGLQLEEKPPPTIIWSTAPFQGSPWAAADAALRACAQILGARHCAFVTFAQRGAAERAAEEMAHKLIVRGQRCKLMWGKPQAERRPPMDPMMPSVLPPGAPGMPPPSMLPPQVRALVACRTI